MARVYSYGCPGGNDQFEFDGLLAVDRAVGGLERAVHIISVGSRRSAPGVGEIAVHVVQQPNPSATVRYASVQGRVDGNDIGVQSHVRRLGVRHGLRSDRPRPGERPFG